MLPYLGIVAFGAIWFALAKRERKSGVHLGATVLVTAAMLAVIFALR